MLVLPLFVVLLAVCHGLPVPVQQDSESSALYYLMKYGYIHEDENSNTAALLSANGVKSAIKDFQAFAGLNQTGDLDDTTVKLMNTPRCGVTDIVGKGATARRRKRYALQGSRWRTRDLTYRITKYPSSSRFSRKQVDDQIQKAFELWSTSTNLNFQAKSKGSVHIEIRFERKEHGDGDPFDGPGGTLAHAYFPQYGGDAHFDDQEYWTIDSFKGTNLLQTAAHEFGHSLGLSHSDVNSALMAPFYRGWQPNLKLHQDDVDAIQALYGRYTGGGSNTPTTTKSPPSNPATESPAGDGDNTDLCRDGRVDTVFSTGDGSYYVFKGSKYWKLTDDSVDSGYPRNIASDWPGLPNNIDAAVTWTDTKKTYFFKGDKYWKFDNQEPASGYPKDISAGFTGIPNNVDSAFVWGGNGKIYFFKGSSYWKFDPSRKPPVRSVYPRPLSNWDLPDGVSAAVKWTNGYTYFFHDDEYYRFDDRTFSVDDGNPSFPRKSGPWWFGCGKDKKAVVKNTDGAAFSLFEDEGDELLDVYPGDEYYQE